MSDINATIDSPFKLKISFDTILKQYEVLSQSEDKFIAAKARRVLKTAEGFPELREGITDTKDLLIREKEISVILQDSFSPILSKNEIKTASVPFHNLIFNYSERFKSIIAEFQMLMALWSIIKYCITQILPKLSLLKMHQIFRKKMSMS